MDNARNENRPGSLAVMLHDCVVPCGNTQTEQLHLQSPPRARAAQTAPLTLPALSDFSESLKLWTPWGDTALLWALRGRSQWHAGAGSHFYLIWGRHGLHCIKCGLLPFTFCASEWMEMEEPFAWQAFKVALFSSSLQGLSMEGRRAFCSLYILSKVLVLLQ